MLLAEFRNEIPAFDATDSSNTVVNGFTGLVGAESRIAVPVDIIAHETGFAFGKFHDETWALLKTDEMLEMCIDGIRTGWSTTIDMRFQHRTTSTTA